jgi:hypothetical protein
MIFLHTSVYLGGIRTRIVCSSGGCYDHIVRAFAISILTQFQRIEMKIGIIIFSKKKIPTQKIVPLLEIDPISFLQVIKAQLVSSVSTTIGVDFFNPFRP